MDIQNDPRALAVAYVEAVGQKQFDRVAELLHPDVEFLTSGRSIRGVPAYVDALRPACADHCTETTCMPRSWTATMSAVLYGSSPIPRRARCRRSSGSRSMQDAPDVAVDLPQGTLARSGSQN